MQQYWSRTISKANNTLGRIHSTPGVTMRSNEAPQDDPYFPQLLEMPLIMVATCPRYQWNLPSTCTHLVPDYNAARGRVA